MILSAYLVILLGHTGQSGSVKTLCSPKIISLKNNISVNWNRYLEHCLESKSYPTLIHGPKQTLKYEIASYMGYEKQKNGNLNTQIAIKKRSSSRQLF